VQEIVLQLSISTAEYLKVYRGQARAVTARAMDGRQVRFPADILKPYITRRGIDGIFVISFDDAGKFRSVRQVKAADSSV
jgi:hypothetical protein